MALKTAILIFLLKTVGKMKEGDRPNGRRPLSVHLSV
jgi:hypothetical protein